jgi:hypothetical protein
MSAVVAREYENSSVVLNAAPVQRMNAWRSHACLDKYTDAAEYGTTYTQNADRHRDDVHMCLHPKNEKAPKSRNRLENALASIVNDVYGFLLHDLYELTGSADTPFRHDPALRRFLAARTAAFQSLPTERQNAIRPTIDPVPAIGRVYTGELPIKAALTARVLRDLYDETQQKLLDAYNAKRDATRFTELLNTMSFYEKVLALITCDLLRQRQQIEDELANHVSGGASDALQKKSKSTKKKKMDDDKKKKKSKSKKKTEEEEEEEEEESESSSSDSDSGKEEDSDTGGDAFEGLVKELDEPLDDGDVFDRRRD